MATWSDNEALQLISLWREEGVQEIDIDHTIDIQLI